MPETISVKPWNEAESPKKILIIRLHAIGDVTVTMSACAGIRSLFPHAQIDFLTTSTSISLLDAVDIFDHQYEIPDIGRNRMLILRAFLQARSLLSMQYDIVIDLQRNVFTRLFRWYLHPKAWGEFDRFSPKPVEQRILESIHRINLKIELKHNVHVKENVMQQAGMILETHGWKKEDCLIVLNPAGLFATRNWPIQNYIHLAQLLHKNRSVRFLFIGTDRILNKANQFQTHFPDLTINLIGKTTLGQALGVLAHADALVSEDSGLVAMGWILGVQTLSLLGSTRHDWSTPLGSHAKCLHSGDLTCGSCLLDTCKYGDVHCLTRYTPKMIFDFLQNMLNQNEVDRTTLPSG